MEQIEYEVKILEINKDEIQNKLKNLNATLIENSFQKRYVYDFKPIEPNKWIRLRTNGKKSTLTLKNIESSNIDGTKEREIEVSDFEMTNEILRELGYIPKGARVIYQDKDYLLNFGWHTNISNQTISQNL